MRFTCLSVAVALLALMGAGCTVLVDGALAGRTGPDAAIENDAGMTDAGPPVGACTGMADGLRCAPEGIVEPFVCVDEVCVLSTCGDGVPDDRDGSMHDPEICDDGNSVSRDGCDPDCTFSCEHDSDCSDGEACTGEENCHSATHACEPGTTAVDGFACTVTGTGGTTEPGMCQAGICRAGACPDGTLDAGEECDPTATPVDGDGCEADCTFTCENDVDCQDGDACNGNETCDTANHLCMAAAARLDCADADPCTSDSCDAVLGCANTSMLVDADMDGHFAITPSCGGDDCNDADAAQHPGAIEACGASSDLDCDGFIGVTPTFYRDCDGDGFAASSAGSVMSCTTPAPDSGCTSWVTREPTGTGTTDCLDTSVGANARPGQTGYFITNVTGLAPPFDYNCDGVLSRQLGTSTSVTTAPSHVVGTCSGGGRVPCTGALWYVRSDGMPPACGSSVSVSTCTPSSGLTCTRTIQPGMAACR
jgi:hypothetical protein